MCNQFRSRPQLALSHRLTSNCTGNALNLKLGQKNAKRTSRDTSTHVLGACGNLRKPKVSKPRVSQSPLPWPACWELRNIYHHHPESKKRESSEENSGCIDPYGRYGNAVEARKTISTIAILWLVKAIFEKRAAMVEVDSFVSRLRVQRFWGP